MGRMRPKGDRMPAVRFATIGRGAIVERFLDALAQSGAAEFVAAYSRDGASACEFARAHGASLWFGDLDALAASPEVDAVYVASPNALHVPQALRLVRSGKHVLVEKALGSNEREARLLLTCARERDVVALEAMRNIHGPGFATVEGMLADVGEPRLARLCFSKVTSRISRLRARERVNVFDPHLSEGSLMDIGVYCVEPAVALFGAPRTVSAVGVTAAVGGVAPTDRFATIDLAGQVTLGYEGKVVGLSFGKVSNGLLDCEVQGERGTLAFGETCRIDHLSFTPHVDRGMVFTETAGTMAAPRSLDIAENDMVYELEVFVAAVRGDASALARVAWAQEVTLSSLAVMDEARRQMGVRFPADDEA